MRRSQLRTRLQAGFTLIELMVSMAVLLVISGAILYQVAQAQQRQSTEQDKLNEFQEARDFVDQFFRDINQIGYPNIHMFDTSSWSTAVASPSKNDNRLAVGLVKVAVDEIRFEGDVDGDGVVDSVVYKINGSGTCAGCLQRSQSNKTTADPLTGQSTSWGTQVQTVVNGTTASPIFSAFDQSGNAVTLPVDITNNASTIATIKTIQISLMVRNPAVIDPQTHQAIETTLQGEISVNNCSMATTGNTPYTCQ